MPDNRYDELDGQFIDQAWGDMRARLDREMPVQRDGRGWLWLLLLLLLGAAGALGGWWYLQRPPAAQPAPGVSDPVAGREMPEAQQPLRLDDPVVPSGKDLVTETETLKEFSPETKSSPHQATRRTEDGPTEPPVVKMVTGEDPSVRRRVLMLPTLLGGKAGPVQSEVHSMVPELPAPAPGIAAAGPERPTLSPFDPLAGRPVSALSIRDYSLAPEIAGPLSRSRFRFGLEGAVLAETGDFTGGWSAGLAARYEPAKGRWGAVTGLNWQQVGSRSLYEHSNLALAESDISSPEFPDTTGFTNAGAIQGRYLAELESTTYLTLPLQAVYRLSRQFSLEAGVQFAYLVAHRQTARYEFDLTDNFNASPTVPRQQYSLTDRSYEAQPVNRLDVALGGGLGFYPGNRWGIRAHYNHGLVRTLESDVGRVYNRQVRLSLTYFINR